MVKKKLKIVQDWFEECLRALLARITPDGRIAIIIVMIILSGFGSIFMTVSSIYNMGKKNGRQQVRIEHIKRLELEHKQEKDSTDHTNNFKYE